MDNEIFKEIAKIYREGQNCLMQWQNAKMRKCWKNISLSISQKCLK